MNQPDLFPAVAFSVNPRAKATREFNPHPTPDGCTRLLGRCRVKGCKFCKAADLPMIERPSYVGTGTIKVIDAHALAVVRELIKCTDHPGIMLEFAKIEGTKSDAHDCDPRCTSAIGPICVCSCGGANHGCNWL